MRFTVESWSPDYGAPLESMGDEEEGRRGSVDAFVEKPVGEWRPLDTTAEPAGTVLFVDGVQRIDGAFASFDADADGDGAISCQEAIDAAPVVTLLEPPDTPFDCAGTEDE